MLNILVCTTAVVNTSELCAGRRQVIRKVVMFEKNFTSSNFTSSFSAKEYIFRNFILKHETIAMRRVPLHFYREILSVYTNVASRNLEAILQSNILSTIFILIRTVHKLV